MFFKKRGGYLIGKPPEYVLLILKHSNQSFPLDKKYMIPAPMMLIDTTTPIPGLKKAHIVPVIALTIPNRTEIKTLNYYHTQFYNLKQSQRFLKRDFAFIFIITEYFHLRPLHKGAFFIQKGKELFAKSKQQVFQSKRKYPPQIR